jgi:hypothetical protein
MPNVWDFMTGRGAGRNAAENRSCSDTINPTRLYENAFAAQLHLVVGHRGLGAILRTHAGGAPLLDSAQC